MLDYTKEDLQELGAEITTREIYQQPSVWKETARLYQERKAEIKAFLEKIGQEHDYIKVILTGAGTSAYVGDTLVPYLQEVHDERHWNFQSIATTDIVAHPQTYLKKEVPTILVSFARSGNSPESVATVQLAQGLVDELIRSPLPVPKKENWPSKPTEMSAISCSYSRKKPTMLVLP